MNDAFRFDVRAKRTRLTDGDLIAALQEAGIENLQTLCRKCNQGKKHR